VIFMIGICEDERGNTIGYRMLDTNTMKTMDATYDSVYGAIHDRRIRVQNMVVIPISGALREIGERMSKYPRVMKNQGRPNKVFTLIGVERDDDINQGIKNGIKKLVCINVNGLIYKMRPEHVERYRENYGIIISNNYMVRRLDELEDLKDRGIREERDELNGGLKELDMKLEELHKKLGVYKSKYTLLGIEEPIIDMINGNITLISVNNKIENIVIPPFVTHIGDSAFEGCDNLKNINLHGNIKYIGSYAFSLCRSLKEITIPENVEEIGIGLFYLSGIERAVINNRMIEIPSNTFSGCSKLREVNIPDTVKGIGRSAFKTCKSLLRIDIPKNVEVIDRDAFQSSGLEEVTLDCKIRGIPTGIFSDCKSLRKVSIRDSIEYIGSYAFDYCIALEEINIINKSDKDSVSDSVSDSKSAVSLPSRIVFLGERAFFSCGKIKSIEVPDTVTNISKGVFERCTGMEYIKLSNNLRALREYTFEGCSFKSITIPESVIKIEDWTFKDCKSLEHVEIKNKEAEIGRKAFSGCLKLEDDNLKNIGLEE